MRTISILTATAHVDFQNANRYHFRVMHTSLSDLPCGASGTIHQHMNGPVDNRLREMGLTPGTSITMLRKGWGGCPLQVYVRGYRLLLRADDARSVHITPQ